MADITVEALTEKGIAAMKKELDRAMLDEDCFDFFSFNKEKSYFEPFLDGKLKCATISSPKSKRFLANTIYKAFSDADVKVIDHINHRGLWCWFMLKFGPVYHLKGKLSGTNPPLGTNHEKIIPTGNKYRHHMVALAWAREQIEMHGGGEVLLTGASHKWADFQEQTIQGNIMRSPGCLKLLDALCFDSANDLWKKLGRDVPENRRNTKAARYIKAWLYKLDALHDVYSITYDRLLELAKEDGRFEGEHTAADGTVKTWTMF